MSWSRTGGIILLAAVLAGCTVLTVAGTAAGAAVSIGATAVGTAVDVTVGAAKVTGKVIGGAVDAVTSSDDTTAKERKAPLAETQSPANEPASNRP